MLRLGRSTLRRNLRSAPSRRRRRELEPLEKRIVLSLSPVGDEVAITPPLDGITQFTSFGRSMSLDNDGDFVVVWQQFDTNNPADGFDVFAQVIDRNGTPLTPTPVRVNNTVAGNQFQPVVAMDADGDFVVAWTGPGPEYGTLTDIYARRFNSVGQPLGNEFRVNSNINNPQSQPAIGMDSDGNFTIAWATTGQDLSFFNNVRAKRYDRVGNPIGSEFAVNVDNANRHFQPDVAVSPEGDRILITWTHALPEGPGPVIEFTVYGELYDGRTGASITGDFIVDSGENPSADFDTAGNFIIVYDTLRNNAWALPENPPPRTYDQLGRIYTRDGVQLRPFDQDSIFINELERNNPPRAAADRQVWGYGDLFGGGFYSGFGTGNPSVALDADFDFIATYEGLGAEGFFAIDGYGINQSVWNAAPGVLPQPTVFGGFYSDDYVNTTLDGQSAIWQIAISPDSTGGSFDIGYLYGGFLGPQDPVTITFTPDDPQATADSINDVLEALPYTGIEEDVNLVNSIVVEIVDPFTFNVYFVNSLHSASVLLFPGDSELTTDDPDTEGTFTLTMIQEGYPGSIQTRATIGMEPDGDYVVVWTGYNRDDPSSAGQNLDTTIYYRRYNESTDTAGPRITDVIAPDGNRIEDGEVLPAAITSLTVTFDEEMRQSSVLDVENYKIVRNGNEELIGAILQAVNWRLNPQTNKWEVTLLLDGNGPDPGVTPLEEGFYELVGTTRLRDKVGNPLKFTGYKPNGEAFSRSFAIQVPAGSETRANSTTVNNQYTEREATQPVAADADGDFVVVWVSDSQDGSGSGVYAQLFNADGSKRGAEFRVNTTTIGDQRHANVAMDADGDFVVTWSHFSSATNWDVYGQRFTSNGAPLGREFRVNSTTSSIQRYSSVAMDVDGDFVIVWQSFNQDGSGYGVYAQRYSQSGDRLDGVNEVQVVTFGGSPTGGTFTLTYNGQTTQPVLYTPQSGGQVTAAELEVALRQFVDVRVTAINSLQFQVTFVGSDGSLDVSSLGVGENNTGASSISMATTTQGISGEKRVNDTTLNNQRFPTVAMDSVGNYVVTWTSSGQDGDAPFEQNVYAKRFVNPDSGQAPPNPGPGVQFTLIEPPTPRKWGAAALGTGATITYAFMATGIQDTQNIDGGWTNTAVRDFMPAGAENEIRRAFAAWGAVANINFVEVTDAGEDFGVLAANSANIRIGGHSIGPDALGHAFGPPVAGSDGRAGDIHFDTDDTFQIDFGGPGAYLFHVALHEIGHALGLGHVTIPGQVMTVPTVFQTGLGSGDILGAQYLYGLRDSSLGGEFLVNQTITNDQRWSSVAVDADGDFVIAWTSYGQDGSGNGYGPGFNGVDGIVARRYDLYGAPLGGEFIVNEFRDNNQRYPRVAIDADGDFAIAWQSFQDRSFPSDAPDSYGVYAKVYRPRAVNAGPNGEFGKEFRVNTSIDGNQVNPGIASSSDGRLIVAWSGFGDRPTQSDTQGVFFQRFNAPGADDTPPTVGGVSSVGSLRLVVTFSEEMSTQAGSIGVNSVLNKALWGLAQSGNPISDPFANIEFGLNQAFASGLSTTPSNKWEAVLTLNSPLLLQTNYTLRLSDAAQDLAGNALDGNFDGAAGGDYVKVFQASADSAVGAVGNQFPVNATQTGTQDDSASAINAAGDFVVVWTSATTPGVNGDVRGQRYNSQGVAQGAEFTAHPSTTGNQDSPDVAMDTLGNFVVVWAGAGTQDPEGIYARRFDSLGNALDAQPIFVNLGSPNLNEAQLTPAVARNATGAFVVTWVTKTGAGDQGDVMMRVYNASGTPLTSELPVNTTTAGRQYAPDVAINSNGSFVITWTSEGQDGDQGGIYARRFNAAGVAQGGEFRVNITTAQAQTNSVVTLADTGFFTIAWTSNLQDGNGLGVYLQRYNSAGTALEPVDVRVNQFTAGAQSEPAIAGDSHGNYIVTWSSANQDTSGLGVFARVYTSTGADAFGGEFLVNTTISGDQRRPSLAANDDGDVIITWTGPDSNSTGIYGQRYRFAPSTAPVDALPTIAGVRVLHSGNTNNVYTIPVGSGEQLRTVDVGRVDRIQIVFSEDVIVTQNDLTIQGIVQANYAPTGFSYNSATRVASWSLPIIFNDRITITLSEAVRDATGNALDGEWTNPTSLTDPNGSTVSGNGEGGGNFVFKFTILSGDANRDNKITGADFTVWATNFGLFSGDATVRDGDFNGDGFITGADFTIWSSQFGLDYSGGSPAPPPDRTSSTALLPLGGLRPEATSVRTAAVAETLSRVDTGLRAPAHDAAFTETRRGPQAVPTMIQSRAVDQVLEGDDLGALSDVLDELVAA